MLSKKVHTIDCHIPVFIYFITAMHIVQQVSICLISCDDLFKKKKNYLNSFSFFLDAVYKLNMCIFLIYGRVSIPAIQLVCHQPVHVILTQHHCISSHLDGIKPKLLYRPYFQQRLGKALAFLPQSRRVTRLVFVIFYFFFTFPFCYILTFLTY